MSYSMELIHIFLYWRTKFAFAFPNAAALDHYQIILNTFLFCQNKIKSLKPEDGWENFFNVLMLVAMILATFSFSSVTIRVNDAAEL